jgi:hypothetical protein
VSGLVQWVYRYGEWDGVGEKGGMNEGKGKMT